MKRRIYSDADIAALKEHIEGELKDLEELHFTYEMWMRDWRKRMAAQRATEAAE